MEIVLQWLDELDDLIFAGLLLWQRLRRLSLVVALSAALSVHALPHLGIGAVPAFTLLNISLVALATWMIFAAVAETAASSRHSLAREP
jgi:hypothetical protein